MKATRWNGQVVEVYECGVDCVRNEYGMVYRRNTDFDSGELRGYVAIDDEASDCLTVRPCECTGSFVEGADVYENYDVAEVEACNQCQRFACDEDACDAFAAALNREAGQLHFTRAMVNVAGDDYEDRWVPCLALRESKDALTHEALEIECARFAIDLGFAPAPAMREEGAPAFRVDDEPDTWTLEQMLEANELEPEDAARLRELAPGAQMTLGGGAWALSSVTRVR